MIINKDTEMMLFRFNEYKGYSFINEHLSVLHENGYAWMLKLGKRSSITKLKNIVKNGGWLILRSPKDDGSRSFLAKFTEVQEELPHDECYPGYYQELLKSVDEGRIYFEKVPSYQWFRLISIESIDKGTAAKLVVAKTGKKVDDVINTTRTAVMFIKNSAPIEALEVE